ncbi:MipA/OmpV family protein [Hydrocarboniphaga effusa]|uniref:MipA/OmpV family protein n=1 Tax=Hydrocarboniphaga effusa TaxID=243629 RepID=UPI0035B1EB1D
MLEPAVVFRLSPRRALRLLSPACLLTILASSPSIAQAEQPSRWGLGAATVMSVNPYAGRGMRLIPFPAITYQSDRFYFFGIRGGAHLYDDGVLSLDAFAAARLDGIDAEDFGRSELADNGIDRDDLSNRKDGVDLGLSASLTRAYGRFTLEASGDVTGASDGMEVELGYAYPFKINRRLMIIPSINLSWMSSNLADYYYGTMDKEVDRGAPLYRPGDSFVPQVGVELRYGFAERWTFLGMASYSRYTGDLADSPLLESGNAYSLILAVQRTF